MINIEVNGLKLTCNRRGKGELLVLVHGAVGDYRTWENQIEPLAKHFDVVSYSRRWHFPETVFTNGADYTAQTHVADLLGLIRTFGTPVHLVGHSYGAAVAAMATLRRPDLVRSLVLAEASLFSLLLTEPGGGMLVAKSAAGMTHITPLVRDGNPEKAVREFVEVILGPRGFDRISPRAQAVMIANAHTIGPMLNGMNVGNEFTADNARSISARTLIVSGELSPAVFRQTSLRLALLIPRAEHRVLAGVSHGLHLEAPEVFTQLVLDFLRK